MDFTDYQKMIQKLAHVMSTRFNVEYDDMEAQGYLIYCECAKKFDMTKASFSTYLYINLSGRLKDYGVCISRQKGLNLYDLVRYDEDEVMDNCPLLAYHDECNTCEDILDSAKGVLSSDSYTLLSWIMSRAWERKGRKMPSISSAIELLKWSRTKVEYCWEECRDFWLREGAAFCC